MDVISTPSMTILPCAGSTKRKSESAIVLFPLPVRPTRPIFSLAAILNDTFFNTGSKSAAYLMTTLSNSIPPFCEGQFCAGRLSVMRGGSGASSMYSEIRSDYCQLS